MKKILVVDDDCWILDACAQMLQFKNYDVNTAADVKEAKRKLEQKKFHMVISDINLPGETGMELLIHIKQKFPGTGVIMMSGNPKISEDECKRGGAFSYLRKPFDGNQFLSKVDAFFSKSTIKK
ncbi:response regulator [bacterium]|nr:response regulator [Candidatus Omnitrophota bacterium]MBU2527814.1 response regulator [bacterium]MBU3930729.1 response regulator [bacterium]MBU4122055.1 response regulator [bacterium]